VLVNFSKCDTPTPSEVAEQSMLKDDVQVLLGALTDRERAVVCMRFGIGDGRTRTLEEIGNIFEVTRERVRQIEARALTKLRQPGRNSQLREYLSTTQNL